MTGKDKKWEDAMRAKGHTPIMIDGELDYFSYTCGVHNGPGCETCGCSWCWHCGSVEDIPHCSMPCLELTATAGWMIP